MTFSEFEREYAKLGENPKTATVDAFNKRLIKDGVDVSFLRGQAEQNKYFRTYFQVSIGNRKTLDEKFAFIEENFDLLADWWHVDCLMVFLGDALDFDYALGKAQQYVKSELPYVKRFGYVMFIPRLTKDRENNNKLFSLLKNDCVHHVVMGEAWLISYIAMTDANMAFDYLKNCNLGYNIVGKAIQKICDSFVISAEDKERFKSLREQRKLIK